MVRKASSTPLARPTPTTGRPAAAMPDGPYQFMRIHSVGTVPLSIHAGDARGARRPANYPHPARGHDPTRPYH
jgi:hypothetical protein